jgi:hypothetical protein
MCVESHPLMLRRDLAACSREQVQSLAKLLNIEGGKGPKASASVGVGIAAGTSKVDGAAAANK